MTLDELETFRFLKQEAEEIARQLDELDTMLLPGHENTGTHSSRPSDPTSAYVRKKLALEERLSKKTMALLDEYARIEMWVESLDDSEVATIVRRRFFRGEGWRKIANAMYGYGSSESTPRMRLTRFLEDN